MFLERKITLSKHDHKILFKMANLIKITQNLFFLEGNTLPTMYGYLILSY